MGTDAAVDEDVRVSVIIPTHNGLDRLIDTIRSVLAQDVEAHEIIVVDDGATDGTPSVVDLFGDRIIYLRVAHGGQQRARNQGVMLSTGNWIALLDHDDLLEAGYLRNVTALVRANDVTATFCNSRTWQESEDGGGWTDSDRFQQFAPKGYWERIGIEPAGGWAILDRYPFGSYLEFHPLQTSMIAVRRDLYLALGGFEEKMRGNTAENFEFELKLIREARIGLICEPLVKMVRHGTNTSRDTCRMAIDVVQCLDFVLENHRLTDEEHAMVAAEIQARLPAAIYGSFALGKYDAVGRYRAAFRGSLPFKLQAKVAVARLPMPIAGTIAALITR